MTSNKPTFIRWKIFSILALASFISYTLRYNISTAAPVMMADLGLTEIQWGWVLATFMTGYTKFQLPGGILGDRSGSRVETQSAFSMQYSYPGPHWCLAGRLPFLQRRYSHSWPPVPCCWYG